MFGAKKGQQAGAMLGMGLLAASCAAPTVPPVSKTPTTSNMPVPEVVEPNSQGTSSSIPAQFYIPNEGKNNQVIPAQQGAVPAVPVPPVPVYPETIPQPNPNGGSVPPIIIPLQSQQQGEDNPFQGHNNLPSSVRDWTYDQMFNTIIENPSFTDETLCDPLDDSSNPIRTACQRGVDYNIGRALANNSPDISTEDECLRLYQEGLIQNEPRLDGCIAGVKDENVFGPGTVPPESQSGWGGYNAAYNTAVDAGWNLLETEAGLNACEQTFSEYPLSMLGCQDAVLEIPRRL